MLTAKENMREVIRGGNPDRFVNQYEAMTLLPTPYLAHNPSPKKGEENVVNAWGVTNSFPENTPGGFPVHTPDKIVVKDIENWREYVHAPSLDFPPEEWAAFKAMYDAADDRAFKCAMIVPGLFEMTHHLCSIDDALVYYMTNPDEMHELIDYLTEFELKLAELVCEHLKPEVIFHHDDWGSETNSFLRPEMFEEFFVEPYKKIYGYYKSHGVEFIVHHSDSYCANLIPYMVEMGIDVWQGCMQSNNVPELIKQYGDKITFMGDIDNKAVDFTGFTQADAHKAAWRAMDENGLNHFIPCITQGGPGSVFPGRYKALAEEIAAYNEEKFGFTKEEQAAGAPPMVIMFGAE